MKLTLSPVAWSITLSLVSLACNGGPQRVVVHPSSITNLDRTKIRAYHADVAMECEYDGSGHLLQISRFPVTVVLGAAL
jgi:hypothetical protein